MLRAGDIVFASFGHGLKTFKVRVAVLSVDWRHAMLIASDREVYGPARITALQTCHKQTNVQGRYSNEFFLERVKPLRNKASCGHCVPQLPGRLGSAPQGSADLE